MAAERRHKTSEWRRIDRREFLRRAARAGVGLAAMSLPAVATAQPKPSGRLVFALGSVGPNLDPGTARVAPVTIIYAALYDTCTRLNTHTGAVEPWLAESWRTVDSKTVEFKLRRGILFHNGRELHAEDVKFTVERLLDPARNKGLTVTGTIITLDRVEVVDPHTFRVVAKENNPIIPLLMSRVFIVPAAEFRAAGDPAQFFSKPIGTGAFRFRAFQRDSHVELVAAGNSWRKPRLAEIRFQALKEDSTRIAALESGQADLIDSVPPDQLKRLQAAGLKVEWTTVAANYAFDLYGPAGTPHANLEVRRAIAHAIDWNTIIKELYMGYGKVGNGLIGGPGAFGWANDPVKYPYDPARARQLLAAAGYPNGFKTRFTGSRGFMVNDVTTAEAIGGYLKAVNIDVALNFAEFSAFLQQYQQSPAKGRSPLFAHRQSYEVTMEVGTRLVLFDDPKSSHPYGWNDPKFLELLAGAQKEMDLKKREQMLIEANRMVVENAISIAAFQPPYILVHSPKVGNVKAPPDALVWMDDIVKSA
jgi:peptide/nickel transport system substrate-binding protein